MLGTEITVVVGIGGGLALVPPQPMAKLSKHTSANPRAGWRVRRLKGDATKSRAANPARKLSVHQISRPGGSIIPEAWRRTGIVTALVPLDGARVDIVSIAVAGVLLLSVTDDGEMLQVAPGIEEPFPQPSATVLVKLVVGVTVIVVVPVCPAVMASGVELAEMLKSGIVTLTKTLAPEAV